MTYIARPPIAEIIKAAAFYIGRPPADLKGPDRTRELAHTRHAITAVATRHGYSCPDIGAALGGRDHTTALHSRQRAAELLEVSQWFRDLVSAIEAATAPAPRPVATVFERPGAEWERLKRRIAKLEYELEQLKGAR